MSGFRSPEVPGEQLVLWSQRLDDAIPADHAVRQVDYLLHSEAFRDRFREWERMYMLVEGKPPYHPRELTGLYLYGMLNRIRSSRQLEAACYNRLDVIWLLSGQHPDHSTIAAFVGEHAKELRRVFKDVLRTSQDYKKSGVVIHRQYGGCAGCATCPKAVMCCRDSKKGRMVNRDQYEEYRERLRVRMDTDVGRQRYQRRRETVEPRFGLIPNTGWGFVASSVGVFGRWRRSACSCARP